jgi:hypothetical protein
VPSGLPNIERIIASAIFAGEAAAVIVSVAVLEGAVVLEDVTSGCGVSRITRGAG